MTWYACVQPMAPSVQLRKYSQHRLANDNDATDQIPVIIDTATSNGVAVELFPIVQAPITLRWQVLHWIVGSS